MKKTLLDELKPYPDGDVIWHQVHGSPAPCYCRRDLKSGLITPLNDELQARLKKDNFSKVTAAFGIGVVLRLKVPDGRVFVVPPTAPTFTGDPVPHVLDIEARTRTRLVDGGDPCWFIRLHKSFTDRRDPDAGVSFGEFASTRHAGKVAWLRPGSEEPKPTRPDGPDDVDGIWVGGVVARLSPNEYQAVKFLWGKWRALQSEAAPAIWSTDDATRGRWTGLRDRINPKLKPLGGVLSLGHGKVVMLSFNSIPASQA